MNLVKEALAKANSNDNIKTFEFKDNEIIADLHVHSRFSRATSKNLTIANLVKYARIKGIDILGTSDFTHPLWLKELKDNLKENENQKGLFWFKDEKEEFPFILSSEISLIYTQDGKGRRVHLVLLAPSFEIVDKINAYLDTKGRRDYDGRPIFGISCKDFVKNLKEITDEIEIIPAHIWTPWFGVLGSRGGFNSLQEAFGEQIENIYTIETGMSSDPEMNWRLEEINNKAIISFSDSHSFWPWRLAREATIFSGNIKNFSYSDLIQQIRENSFLATIETDPAYGKYHWDGHRKCDFSCPPEKTRELKGICPICHQPLIIGVEYRVEELANNPKNFVPKNAKAFFKLLPLHELIAFSIKSSLASKKTWEIYNLLVNKFKNEFNVLLKVDREKLIKLLPEKIDLVDLIINNRIANIKVKPGYDGEYGKLDVKIKEKENSNQKTLF